MVIPHMSPTPGMEYSLKELVEGSNLPTLLTFDSVNHTAPCLSTVIARGAAFSVGTVNSSMYLGRSPDAVTALVESRIAIGRTASKARKTIRAILQTEKLLDLFR